MVVVHSQQLGFHRGEVDRVAAAACVGNELLGAAAGSAELAEGDRVAAGLGGEVPAKAELVGPLPEQPVREVGEGALAAGGDPVVLDPPAEV